MFIHCKKTGEEYEITDREIGEKVECPCCGGCGVAGCRRSRCRWREHEASRHRP